MCHVSLTIYLSLFVAPLNSLYLISYISWNGVSRYSPCSILYQVAILGAHLCQIGLFTWIYRRSHITPLPQIYYRTGGSSFPRAPIALSSYCNGLNQGVCLWA